MKLSLSKLFSTPSTIPFGLDISDFYIRLIQLKGSRGRNFALQTSNELTLPPGIITGGEIIDNVKLSQLIKQLISQAPASVGCQEVLTALPEPKTFIKMVTFNWPEETLGMEENKKEENNKINQKEKTFYKILSDELAEDVPLSLEEANLDYHFLKEDLNKITAGQEAKALVAVAPKKITDDYTKILEDSGLVPVALEIEGMAIARAVIKQEETKKEIIKIIIDLGASRTGLIIYHNNSVRYSLSIPISGRQITQTIADEEKISFSEAEKLKLASQLNTAGQDKASKIVNTALENIISRIKEAMIFCQLKISAEKKPEILLCGGGANWPGLTALLSQRLETAVTVADPWINFANRPPNFTQDKSLSYTTAIGLALGGLYDYA